MVRWLATVQNPIILCKKVPFLSSALESYHNESILSGKQHEIRVLDCVVIK